MINISKIYGLNVKTVNKISKIDARFINNITERPPVEEWLQCLDDTYWKPAVLEPAGYWDGTKWIAEVIGEAPYNYYGIYLEVIGDWAVDFRPSKVRVTLNSAGYNFYLNLFDVGEAALTEDILFDPLSDESVVRDLDFSEAGDILYLLLDGAIFNPEHEAPYITNIEFL
jgi:hypothetical protein